METYNFVDYKSEPKRTGSVALGMSPLPKSHLSLPAKRYRTFETAIEKRKFISFRSVLIFIGSRVTEIGDALKSISRAIDIAFFMAAFITFGSFFLYKIYTYFENHTSPLQLASLQETEIARLDKILADFAMENYVSMNAAGDIDVNNAEIPPDFIFHQPVTYQKYRVVKGDSVSVIAQKFGLSNISTLISVNNIENVRTLAVGQILEIPSFDGIIYNVKPGDSIQSISAKQGVSVELILDANDLISENLNVGQVLFLPGAKLDQKVLSLAMGDQFVCPIKAPYRFSSRFGARIDPISGKKSYHKGDDLACPTRTPIFASLSGKVIYVGETWLYGKHIIIDHGNGYQTLYAHMSQIIATKDQWVTQNTRIGLVGSTGYSTGPHLHFTVYKNGNPIAPSSVVRY